jgi:hypothetical protein
MASAEVELRTFKNSAPNVDASSRTIFGDRLKNIPGTVLQGHDLPSERLKRNFATIGRKYVYFSTPVVLGLLRHPELAEFCRCSFFAEMHHHSTQISRLLFGLWQCFLVDFRPFSGAGQ